MLSCIDRRLTIALLVVLLSVAPVPVASGSPADTESGPPYDFPLADFSITLERGFHESVCPTYVVTLRGDGSAECECIGGRDRAVRRVGFSVPQGSLMSLIRTIYSEDFFGLRAKYSARHWVTVGPGGFVSVSRARIRPQPGSRQVFTVRIGEYEKQVVIDVGDHPTLLDDLEDRIDELAGATYAEMTSADEP